MSERIYYFAYGSNMNPQRMLDRGVLFEERVAAKLPGYELQFNKQWTLKPEAGVANINPKESGMVEGILYTLYDISLDKLDEFEINYDRISITVVLANDNKQEAIAYKARQHVIQEGLKPTREYLGHVLKGEDLLSQEYVKKLASTPLFDET